MVDINSTIALIEPISSVLNTAFQQLQLMVGGIIGLYIIYMIIVWRNNSKHVKLLKDIREELTKLNTRVDAIESSIKAGFSEKAKKK